jgi:hypothetical protein
MSLRNFYLVKRVRNSRVAGMKLGACDEACQPRFRRDLASSPPDLENNPPCLQLSLLSFLRIILNTRA